jgi:hypothetical protein
MDKRGTMGTLEGPGLEKPLFTLEEPWKSNKRRISCIPAGTYKCKPHAWGADKAKFHFQEVWEVTNVPDRKAILMHAGNTLADTEGCILVGLEAGIFRVNHSRPAINKLRQIIGNKEFTLTIQEMPNAKR